MKYTKPILSLFLSFLFVGLGINSAQAQCEPKCEEQLEVALPLNDNLYQLAVTDVLSGLPLDICYLLGDLEVLAPDLDCSLVDSTVAYTVRLKADTTVSCTGNIVVKDETPPGVTCKDLVEVQIPPRGVATLDAGGLINFIFDNCAEKDDFEVVPAVVDCSNVGDTLSYQLSRKGIEENLCSGSFVVVDEVTTTVILRNNPTVELPADTTAYQLQVSDVVWYVLDNCSSVDDLAITDTVLTCVNAGTAIPYQVYIKETGEVVAGGFVNVVDDTPAQVVCQDTVYAQLPVDGTPLLLDINELVDTLLDNCADFGMLALQADTLSCAQLGDTLTYQIIDTVFQQTVCSGLVIVEGSITTGLGCIANAEVQLPADGSPRALSVKDVMTGFDKACLSPDSLLVFPDTIRCADVGAKVPYQVVLAADSSLICSDTLRVIGGQPLSIKVKLAVAVELPNSGVYELKIEDVLESFDASCASVDDLIVEPATVDCGDVGSIQSYRVVHRLTGDVYADGRLRVDNTVKPFFEHQREVKLTLPEDGSTLVLTPDMFLKYYYHNCSTTDDLAVFPAEISCRDAGQQVGYEIYNKRTGIILTNGSIEVEDDIPVNIYCKTDATLAVDPDGGFSTLQLADVLDTFEDNCLSQSELELSGISADCGLVGEVLPYEVSLSSTGEVLCSGFVTVTDEEGPLVSCRRQAELVLTAEQPTVELSADLLGVSAFDNCSSSEALSYSFFPSSINCANAGKTVIYLAFVKDASGNTGRCVGRIQVEDKGACSSGAQAPVANGRSSELSGTQLFLYPNPAVDYLQVRLPQLEGNVQLRLLDATGAQHMTQKLDATNQTELRLPVDILPQGLYLIVLENEAGIIDTQRFTKQ